MQEFVLRRYVANDKKRKKTWKGFLVNRKKNGSLYTEEMTITPS
jgi:hypothetical protein